MRPKEVVRQIAEAMPEDASLADFEEFLFERSMVEAGRAQVAAGASVDSSIIVPWDLSGAWDTQVVWAEQAGRAFADALTTSHSGSPEQAKAFLSAIAAVATCERLTAENGHSLPEMGDPSIREQPVVAGSSRYRVVYEVTRRTVHVLWFTDNVTCYRIAPREGAR